MTASDKKKTVLLVVLLAAAATSFYYGYRPASGTAANTPQKNLAKTPGAKAGQEAVIKIDILNNQPSSEVGRKDLFRYRQVQKPPEAQRGFQPAFVTPIPQPGPSIPVTPQPPAPPPFRSFRFEGFSVSKGGGKILGSLTDVAGGNTYEVKEGDCLMGQYCVTRLTENLIEIEDLQLKRRQSFTRTQ
jgi:hypothetical protein